LEPQNGNQKGQDAYSAYRRALDQLQHAVEVVSSGGYDVHDGGDAIEELLHLLGQCAELVDGLHLNELGEINKVEVLQTCAAAVVVPCCKKAEMAEGKPASPRAAAPAENTRAV
jgi:uncharacterized protein (DUF1501 family)